MMSVSHHVLVVALLVLYVQGEKLDDGSHYTNTWAVELHSDLSTDEVTSIAHKHGFINHGKIFPNSNLYEFGHPKVSKHSTEHAHVHNELLAAHVHVKSVDQQIARLRVKRSEPEISLADPLWPQTWYLNRGALNADQHDMNVISAWNKGYTGKNIVVTILDDGIERNHPDLLQNYSPEASTDINGRDSDPTPRYDPTNENRHGTRCAGEVAAAANNSYCSVGVAYDAKIGGIRMLDGFVTDGVEAKAMSFNPDGIDIYSSSWGPDDNGRTVDGPNRLAKKAIEDGATKGRYGKGNIFVWASGNGGRYQDSCACDGYANSIYTLSVSSATEGNNSPWYLEQCASTLVATYSSGAYREKSIVTSDLRNTCTSSHTGTSASAPLAAGIIAVMLEANPSLTWRDVQYITLAAANPTPLLRQGEFNTNGVGRLYSHKFGYGLMDCGKMTEIAESWQTVSPQLTSRLPTVYPDYDLSSRCVLDIDVADCSVSESDCIRHLEHVQILVNMTSEERGKLSVNLTSPQGTQSTMLPTRRSDTTSGAFSNFTFMSVHFWGEAAAGTWKLEIGNDGESGKLHFYQLSIYGVSQNPFNESTTSTNTYTDSTSAADKSTTTGSITPTAAPDNLPDDIPSLFQLMAALFKKLAKLNDKISKLY